jgi:hypothetical protein
MKLLVEIKDNKFTFEYEIGESKHSGSSHLCADNLCVFTALLQQCSRIYQHRDKEWEREVVGKAWVEKQTKIGAGDG